jgi:hypothetical protein
MPVAVDLQPIPVVQWAQVGQEAVDLVFLLVMVMPVKQILEAVGELEAVMGRVVQVEQVVLVWSLYATQTLILLMLVPASLRKL